MEYPHTIQEEHKPYAAGRGQDEDFVRIVRTSADVVLRITIHWDHSHAFQSRARAELWTGNGWTEVAAMLANEVGTRGEVDDDATYLTAIVHAVLHG